MIAKTGELNSPKFNLNNRLNRKGFRLQLKSIQLTPYYVFISCKQHFAQSIQQHAKCEHRQIDSALTQGTGVNSGHI